MDSVDTSGSKKIGAEGGWQRPSGAELSWVAGLIVAGIALRFYQLGGESIWGDEAYSLKLAGMGFKEIAQTVGHDSHPPLYFWLLKMWCWVLPRDLWSIRAFSAVESVMILPLFWVLARLLLTRAGAIVALALMTFSPYQLNYAQEARMYAQLCLAETGLVLGAVALFAERSPIRGRLWLAAGLWLATLAAVLTHFYFIFVVAWAGLLALDAMRRRRGRGTLLYINWIWWAGALTATFAIQMASRMKSGANIEWIPPLSFDTFQGIAQAFAYGVSINPKPRWIIYPLLLALAVLLVAAMLAPKEQEEPGRTGVRLILWSLLTCCIGMPVAISIVRPIVYYGERYLIIATVPVYLIAGLGFDGLRERISGWGGATLAGLMVVVLLTGMARYHVDYFDSRQKRPYDTAAQVLDERFAPGAAIFIDPGYTAACLQYYLKSPYELLPGDLPSTPEAVLARKGTRVWFVRFAMEPSPAEAAIIPQSKRVHREVFQLADNPMLILRLTEYELP